MKDKYQITSDGTVFEVLSDGSIKKIGRINNKGEIDTPRKGKDDGNPSTNPSPMVIVILILIAMVVVVFNWDAINEWLNDKNESPVVVIQETNSREITITPPSTSPTSSPSTTRYPASQNCTVSGSVRGWKGRFTLEINGSSGTIYKGGSTDGYLDDISYNSSTGRLYMNVYNLYGDYLAYYDGTLTVKNGKYTYQGTFSNGTKYGHFYMTGYR